jgi:hypothetical protein
LGFLFVGCTAMFAAIGGSGDVEGAGGDGASQEEPAPQPERDAASEEEAPEDEAAPEGQEPEQEETPERRTVAVGEPVNVGEVAWVVNNAAEATELQSQFGEFGENQQGNFVVIDFTFTNNSAEAVTLDTVSMVLVDGGGRRFEADPAAFEYIDPNRMIFLEQVNPGVSREGTAIFTVAPDASGFTLELGDAAFFSDETGFVELAF